MANAKLVEDKRTFRIELELSDKELRAVVKCLGESTKEGTYEPYMKLWDRVKQDYNLLQIERNRARG